MPTLPPSVDAFLKGRRLAVAGVSRQSAQPANAIFRRLKASGYEVYPVNPNAAQVEGTDCYPDVAAVPARLDGVVVVTPPAAAAQVVRQCHDAGVPRVWFHRSFGEGSVSAEAVRECQGLGIDCIVGGCPMMFCEPVDMAHRCMRWWLQRRGTVPRSRERG
jgi:predicted CoA-binding protein